MSTTSTDSSWFWYFRKKGKNGYLGIIDRSGDAPDTAGYDIEIWYDEIPDEITSGDDNLPIPVQFEHGFSMGCVYDLLRMHGIRDESFRRDYEDAIEQATAWQNEEANQPIVIVPLDMRDD